MFKQNIQNTCSEHYLWTNIFNLWILSFQLVIQQCYQCRDYISVRQPTDVKKLVGRELTWATKVFRANLPSATLDDLVWDWTWTIGMGSQQMTTWAIAQPCLCFLKPALNGGSVPASCPDPSTHWVSPRAALGSVEKRKLCPPRT
jgi:hypothetical protein